MTEYRILELRGDFIIQGKFKKTHTTGMFWWKKSHEEEYWTAVNFNGRETYCYFHLRVYSWPMPPFKSLEEAKEQVRLFKKEPVYYTA